MCTLQCQTAGHKSVCSQVLWPAYCIEGFCCFFESCSKCSAGAHITFHHVHCVWHNTLISKFDPNTARTPILSLSFSLHTQNSPIPVTFNFLTIPITFTPSLPMALSCLEPTSSRTSGHCVVQSHKMPCHFPYHTWTEEHKHLSCVQTGQCYLLPATTLLRPGNRGGHVN